MLFVVRRLQELGRGKKIPLNMYFVDLNKAYDSVDREMLRKVLARAGIPAKLIEVIRQFHDGMRARVRMDDGELSDWFFVTQGVRQGCVLSEGLARMMTIIVEVFGGFELTVSEKKTETLLMRAKDNRLQHHSPPPPPLTIEAAGQKYAQTTDFRCLGGLVNEHGDLTREINYRSRGAWAHLRRYGRELFDRPQAPF
ncbi:unnamed protein product [Ectocarpus sp. CCAP 1310/34]|nr:unnamed protein product [Ectocarpus sp. CCAP 1310/34]